MPTEEITPIRQQYLDIKKKYPDVVLFFRLGDFYETFDHDAEITSKELDIVLTSRSVAKGVRIPMAGIPFHAIDNYLGKLIDKGYHVAICEQVGTQPVQGLFPREVVRIVTPGTLIESTMLPADRNNYLLSLDVQDDHAGIAFADISTGDFKATELTGSDIYNQVRAELARLAPAEIIIPDSLELENNLPGHVTRWQDYHFDTNRCKESLLAHFKAASLDGFGLRGLPYATLCAGVIIQYLEENQPSALPLLSSLSTYQISEFMTLDAATRRNLELTETIRGSKTEGTLLNLLDFTVTPMGHRLIREWINRPMLDIEAIKKRQEGVKYFVENGFVRAEFFAFLKEISDLERITNRILSGHALPRDLVALRATLKVLPEINKILTVPDNAIKEIISQIAFLENEKNLLEQSLVDDPPSTLMTTGIFRPGFSTELDNIMESSKHAREWIANLETQERDRTGIKSLKVGYNKVFGYFIEITHSNTNSVPSEYIRKQTLVNAERYITPEMKEYETLVLNAEGRIHEIELKLFRNVCDQLATESQKLLSTARTIANLDVLSSLAEAAVIGGYVQPQIEDNCSLEIHDCRHPVVEKMLSGERFVPNDAIFAKDEIIRIITGPNMSGKSTFLRQVALIVLLAQIGSYVPASSAKIGLVDRIFTRIGAQDEIYAGQSTFMVEMTETANILHHATKRSLLILDEVGRGTSTYDGVAIAWSVVEYIHNHPNLHSRTLFATHYHELIQLSEILPGVKNYNVAVVESDGKIVFLHKIIPGGSDRSYGIHVAQLAGLPGPLIQRANEIITNLETTTGRTTETNQDKLQQLALFPETNPILDELKKMDVNAISPIEAITKLYEWKKRFQP
jgi:DNA mismatch repair protein MutS